MPDAAVVCEVWDSGPGIPDAHKLKVFERFHRVDETRRGDQSTGIGLAITQSIVEGHGGQVWVEDESNGGSRIVLLLESPVAEGKIVGAEGGAELSTSNRRSILRADSSPASVHERRRPAARRA